MASLAGTSMGFAGALERVRAADLDGIAAFVIFAGRAAHDCPVGAAARPRLAIADVVARPGREARVEGRRMGRRGLRAEVDPRDVLFALGRAGILVAGERRDRQAVEETLEVIGRAGAAIARDRELLDAVRLGAGELSELRADAVDRLCGGFAGGRALRGRRRRTGDDRKEKRSDDARAKNHDGGCSFARRA